VAGEIFKNFYVPPLNF